MRKLDQLVSEARKAAVVIRNFQGTVRVVSHYDADGIASASIIALALSREGRQFRLSIIKQLSDRLISQLAEERNLLVIFADLGSGHLQAMQERLVFPGAKVLILDHHQAKGEVLPENRESVIHVNPLSFGISENLSGAGVTYLLAKELDPENVSLAYLGVVGAVGDSQVGSIEEKWGLSGPNREILKDAKKSELLTVAHGLRIWGKYSRPLHKALEYCTDPLIPGISGSESAAVQFLTDIGIALKKPKSELTDDRVPASFQVDEWRTLSDLSHEEQKTLASGIIKERVRGNQKSPHDIFGEVYEIPANPPEFRSAEEFATVLNACGKLGKPYVGLSMCMASQQAFGEAEKLLSRYRKDIGKAIRLVNQSEGMIMTTDRGTYMLAGDRVSEHIISNLVSIFNKSGFVPEDRPVFAFADAEDGMVKVSARAHDLLVENGMNMESLVSAAASRFGGEGGGHKGAAGATIPKASQDKFISLLEEMLAAHNNINTNIPEQQVKNRTEASSVTDYGTAKAESGREGSEEGREREGSGISSPGISPPAPARGKGPEEVEGEGLVRYFGSKNVQ